MFPREPSHGPAKGGGRPRLNLDLSPYLDLGLRSQSQQSRVATEAWVGREFYCASCGSGLAPFKANTPVYDFYSELCGERFQLKASRSPIARSVLGADFRRMWQSIANNSQPSLILLHYDRPAWRVRDLSLVHRACITVNCVRRRKPLAATAQRAGWEGCNIVLDDIPSVGRIPVVSAGEIREKRLVLDQWKRTSKLLGVKPIERGWLADVLRCIERLFSTFTLENLYSFEAELGARHPDNHHVKAKIRQQLQVLRDLGFVEFVSPGIYRRLS